MAEKIAKVKVKREKGYLYFIDGKGNVARAPMARAGKKAKGKRELVAKTDVKKEAGYLYFLDKDGDVSRAKMARGNKAKKKAGKAKPKARKK